MHFVEYKSVTNTNEGAALRSRGDSSFVPKQMGDFASAEATIFWPAPKYGKNAPVQRGSGSFGSI